MESWQQKFPHQIFLIKYEALLENFEQNARNLISFISLNWEDACLKPELNDRLVLTASSQQVRQMTFFFQVANFTQQFSEPNMI